MELLRGEGNVASFGGEWRVDQAELLKDARNRNLAEAINREQGRKERRAEVNRGRQGRTGGALGERGQADVVRQLCPPPVFLTSAGAGRAGDSIEEKVKALTLNNTHSKGGPQARYAHGLPAWGPGFHRSFTNTWRREMELM